MKKIGTYAAILLLVSIPFASCKKKEPAPPPMKQGASDMTGTPHGAMEGGPEKTISVPADVTAAWKSVKIEVESKKDQSKKVFSIPLHSEFQVPGTGLTIQVGEFLPNFSMTPTTITSASNDLKNPAVRVEVSEKGTSVFKGWLFGKYPDVHPFQHDRFGLKLIEGERK